MVVQAKGQGFGRAALRVAKKVAFDDLGAHRFWLDVKARNTPGQGAVRQRRLRGRGRAARGGAGAEAASSRWS